MTGQLTPSPEQLAAANPVTVDDQLGSTLQAQATLQSIVASDPHPECRTRPRIRHLALVVIALLLASGGALAATDPFGWWHSPNPQTALYRPNPALQVRSPTFAAAGCLATSGRGYRCGLHLHGRPYTVVDHLTRLARVSDSFLAGLDTPRGYGTYELPEPDSGPQLAPPAGVPAFLACGVDGATLDCRDLNGDSSAPTGTGIYMAQQTPDWRPAPPARRNPTRPTPRYTPAQTALLGDIIRYFLTSQRSASSRP